MSTWKVAAAALPIGFVSIGTGLFVLRQAHSAHPPAPAATRTAVSHTVTGELRTPLDAQRAFGTPRVYRNLSITPIYDSGAVASDTYITLDEGLKAKTVQVQESKDGGSVNTLYITNRDKKPLYVMAGEVVLGGQQDRTIGKDIIITAGRTRVPIAVFCVEHGRWTGHADFDSSAKSVASADIRLGAQDGNFKAEHQVALAQSRLTGTIAGRPASNSAPVNAYGVVGTPPIVERQTPSAPAEHGSFASNNVGNTPRAQINARPLLQSANPSPQNPVVNAQTMNTESDGSELASEEVGRAQQKVWDKVATKNARFKTTSDTGTYRTALNMTGGDVSKSAPAYVKALSDSLGHDPHLVGVVAAVNGKIVASDVFSDPVLFQKLWPKLLRSYAADAIEQMSDGKPQAVAITPAQVNEFYTGAVSGKSQEENKTESGANTRLESSQATTFRLVPAPTAKAAAGGGAAAKALHETVLHK